MGERQVPEPNFKTKQPRRSRPRMRDHIAYMRMRREVESRADGRCEARVEGVCLGRGDAAHHIKPRSAGGKDDTGNLLWVCNGGCHAWIHAHPAEAKARGFLQGRYRA